MARTGPSSRVAGRVRWAGAGLGEGGDALHTHPLLPGQVLVIWGGREGGKVVGRGRTDRPYAELTVDAVASADGRRYIWPGHTKGGEQGKVMRWPMCRCPHTNTPVHHTYLKGADFLVLPPSCGC